MGINVPPLTGGGNSQSGTQAKDLPVGMLVIITSAIIIITFKVPEVWRVVCKTKFCSISISLVLPLRRVLKWSALTAWLKNIS